MEPNGVDEVRDRGLNYRQKKIETPRKRLMKIRPQFIVAFCFYEKNLTFNKNESIIREKLIKGGMKIG